MENLNFLQGIVGALAILGYYFCLSRRFWLTLAASLVVGSLATMQYPFESENVAIWVATLVVAASCIIAVWLSPTASHPQEAEKETGRPNQIVIDGTNVLYWDGDGAQMATLRVVVTALQSKGYAPIVFLDASSRHHLRDKSLNEKRFAKALNLSAKNIMVCPAGTEADVFILKFARSERLPIVSNDRFGDRAKQAKGLKIVKGIIAKGRPIFDGL
jgi:biopolymer transport protein ExbD